MSALLNKHLSANTGRMLPAIPSFYQVEYYGKVENIMYASLNYSFYCAADVNKLFKPFVSVW